MRVLWIKGKKMVINNLVKYLVTYSFFKFLICKNQLFMDSTIYGCIGLRVRPSGTTSVNTGGGVDEYILVPTDRKHN